MQKTFCINGFSCRFIGRCVRQSGYAETDGRGSTDSPSPGPGRHRERYRPNQLRPDGSVEIIPTGTRTNLLLVVQQIRGQILPDVISKIVTVTRGN